MYDYVRMILVKPPDDVDKTSSTFARIAKQLNEPKTNAASIGKERNTCYSLDYSNLL